MDHLRVFQAVRLWCQFFWGSLVVTLCSFGSAARAVEVYALYGKGCDVVAGAIVGVDDEQATVLTLAGTIRSLALRDVLVMARYDVLENPFARIDPGQGEHAILDVTSESAEGSFRAYATNFFENLVLFLDDAGKIRVVETDEIVSLVRRPPAAGPTPTLKARAVHLVPPPARASCPLITSPDAKIEANPRPATQILSDKLRIDTFWTRMRSGHRAIEGLRESTMFYPRPLLFSHKTRLGLVAQRSNRSDKIPVKTPLSDLPLYLEFGGGAAYQFQSATTLGSQAWRMVPEVRPIPAVRSEFKSHLLHGMFIGNFDGIIAGKAVYSDSFDPDRPASLWAESTFNHMTLLGTDYGPWSLSYGYYFPDFAFGDGAEFREVVARKTSQVWRLGLIWPEWQLEAFVFNTTIDGDNDRVDNALSSDRSHDDRLLVSYHSERFVPMSARLSSQALKVALTLFPVGATTIQSEVLVSKLRYKEYALRRERSIADWKGDLGTLPEFQVGQMVTNKIERMVYATRAHIRMDLGKWVALSAGASYEQVALKGGFYTYAGASGTHKTISILTYTGAMELLL